MRDVVLLWYGATGRAKPRFGIEPLETLLRRDADRPFRPGEASARRCPRPSASGRSRSRDTAEGSARGRSKVRQICGPDRAPAGSPRARAPQGRPKARNCALVPGVWGSIRPRGSQPTRRDARRGRRGRRHPGMRSCCSTVKTCCRAASAAYSSAAASSGNRDHCHRTFSAGTESRRSARNPSRRT